MIDWFLHSVVAQISTGALIVAALIAAGWFFPLFRKYLWGAAAIVAAFLAAYSKGARDQANAQKRKNEAMVKEKEDEYAKIDARPDTPDDAVKRMRNGSF